MATALRVRVCLASLALCGCPRRPTPDASAAPDVRVDVPPVDVAPDVEIEPPRDVPHTTQGRGASEPWRATGAGTYAVSPAVWMRDAAYSVMAVPTEDLRHAELQWVRWSDHGAEVLARKEVTGMIPGATLALDHRDGSLVVTWLPAIAAPDAGITARAQDLSASGFAGDERAAQTPAEASAETWIRAVTARRTRTGAEEPAPASERNGVSVLSTPRYSSAIVTVDGVEVTRGADLRGYERAVGGSSQDAVRWVGLSRGRCADARVEVYRVEGHEASLRASFPIGEEIGVRWIALDPQPGALVVSWYQDYIPIRIDCGHAHTLSNLDEHGLRVAVVREP